MRLLLDTHAFIWACGEPGKLSEAVRDALSDAENDVFVSAASACEIAIKHALGRIEFPLERFAQLVSDMCIEPLAMTIAHAIAAGSLPRHHEDPFDRMLIAQAKLEGLTLVTVDGVFLKYDVKVFGTAASD
jgi:PIN domain nuclease of toxin-antitoxin system